MYDFVKKFTKARSGRKKKEKPTKRVMGKGQWCKKDMRLHKRSGGGGAFSTRWPHALGIKKSLQDHVMRTQSIS